MTTVYGPYVKEELKHLASYLKPVAAPDMKWVHWQCSGCGGMFKPQPPQPVVRAYGVGNNAPVLIPTLPDGVFRVFCRSCCVECVRCWHTVYKAHALPDQKVCMLCNLSNVTPKCTNAVSPVNPTKRNVQPPSQKPRGFTQNTIAAFLAKGAKLSRNPRAGRLVVFGPSNSGEGCPLFTTQLYEAMLGLVKAHTIKWGLEVESVDLVSGASAWCEFLPIDLYVRQAYQSTLDAKVKPFKSLTILPPKVVIATKHAQAAAVSDMKSDFACDHQAFSFVAMRSPTKTMVQLANAVRFGAVIRNEAPSSGKARQSQLLAGCTHVIVFGAGDFMPALFRGYTTQYISLWDLTDQKKPPNHAQKH